MHFSNTAVFCLTALTSYAAAQANGLAFTTVPNDCQVGQACTIEWEGAGGAVSTSLLYMLMIVLEAESPTRLLMYGGFEARHYVTEVLCLMLTRINNSLWRSSCVRVTHSTSTL